MTLTIAAEFYLFINDQGNPLRALNIPRELHVNKIIKLYGRIR
jgi:hypothetical protein